MTKKNPPLGGDYTCIEPAPQDQLAYLLRVASNCMPYGERKLVIGKRSAKLNVSGVVFEINYATWKITSRSAFEDR